MLPWRPSRTSLAARSRNSWEPNVMTRSAAIVGRVRDEPAVDPAVAPLVEGQVADLLDGRGRHLVHRRVVELVAGVHARHRLLVLVVQVLIDRREPAPGLDGAVAEQVLGLGEDLVLLREVGPLACQERGVFGEDAELGREPHDLVDELAVRRRAGPLGLAGDDARRAALFADRVDQQADLAAGPEPGDEAVSRGRLVERQAEPEDARASPGNSPGARTRAAPAPRYWPSRTIWSPSNTSGMRAGISSRRRLRPSAPTRVRVGVGEDGAAEPLEDVGDLHLDVLAQGG